MLQENQKALFLDSKHGDFVVSSNVVPRPSTGEILVRVETCGLNPVDWKIQTFGVFIETFPFVSGTDAAGIVEDVGSGVKERQKGDKVCVASSQTMSTR